jgi:hypothetical protein
VTSRLHQHANNESRLNRALRLIKRGGSNKSRREIRTAKLREHGAASGQRWALYRQRHVRTLCSQHSYNLPRGSVEEQQEHQTGVKHLFVAVHDEVTPNFFRFLTRQRNLLRCGQLAHVAKLFRTFRVWSAANKERRFVFQAKGETQTHPFANGNHMKSTAIQSLIPWNQP